MLQSCYSNENVYEIGIDEAGRGPLFGPLYVAAVICPKDIPTETIPPKRLSKHNTAITWNHIKDSKKIKNRNHMKLCVDFIKENAVAYAIRRVDQPRIDEINIRQAVFEGMHACIAEILLDPPVHAVAADTCGPPSTENVFLLVDGNDFKPFPIYNPQENRMYTLPYTTIEGGDGQYLSIAAASILAKYTRDEYILNLCQERPELSEKYGIDKNMGYGTKTHLSGIRQWGITQGHRLSYKPCKITPPEEEEEAAQI